MHFYTFDLLLINFFFEIFTFTGLFVSLSGLITLFSRNSVGILLLTGVSIYKSNISRVKFHLDKTSSPILSKFGISFLTR